jgi:hypothetical protein
MENLRVAIIDGDRVVAVSNDVAAVRVAAGMIGSAVRESNPTFWPIAVGVREACRRVATGTVGEAN